MGIQQEGQTNSGERLVSRRAFLAAAATGASGLALAACGASAGSSTTTSGEASLAMGNASAVAVNNANPSALVQPNRAASAEVSPEAQAEQDRLNRIQRNHYFAVIDEASGERKELSITPYLALPFRTADVGNTWTITEGWHYDKEIAITGMPANSHGGVDIAVPYGTPVVAPCDGWVMSSCQLLKLTEDDGTVRTYEGKPMWYSFGNFVQIYVPEQDEFIQICHLSEIDPAIPFSIPRPENDTREWQPTNHNLTGQEYMNNPQVAVFVKKGTVLGKVGNSGLGLGEDYQIYQEGAQRPGPIDPNASWDEAHGHWEVYKERNKKGQKIGRRDPFGIYGVASDYPTPEREGKKPTDPLIIMGENGLPSFAG